LQEYTDRLSDELRDVHTKSWSLKLEVETPQAAVALLSSFHFFAARVENCSGVGLYIIPKKNALVLFAFLVFSRIGTKGEQVFSVHLDEGSCETARL
jgi:hypothetical protein